MAKKNDPTELQNNAELQKTVDSNAAPADTAQPQETALFTLDALADRHRVASWQQAALLRLTGWAAGKEVSETDYTAALNNLQYRRMGSGRA